MQIKNKIIWWLNLCLILICILVAVGGITRLTNSGLSIIDWELIKGIKYPSDNEMDVYFETYKSTTEYQKYRNSNFAIDDYKYIFFWEYFHRILGRIVGLFFLIPLVYFSLTKAFSKKQIKTFAKIFLLICLQGLMGIIMVKTGLGDEGEVSAIALALHLILALIIISLIYWNKLKIKYSSLHYKPLVSNKIINQIIFIFFVQVLFGALCSGLDIGRLFLKISFIDEFLYNFKNNIPYLIQLCHIVLGTIFVINVMYFAKNSMNNNVLFKYSNILSYISITQYFIGMLNIVYEVPIVFGIIHQLLVIIILIVILNLKFLIIFSEKK